MVVTFNHKIMKTFLNFPFLSNAKAHMYELLKQNLLCNSDCLDEGSLLIGNLCVGTFDFDAVLITDNDIFLFEFKDNPKGKITINSDRWLYEDGTPVWAGRHDAATPWEQAKLKRNVMYGLLRKKLQVENLFIKTVILFSDDYELVRGNTFVVYENHRWFLTSSLEGVSSTLEDNLSGKSFIPFDSIRQCLLMLANSRTAASERRSNKRQSSSLCFNGKKRRKTLWSVLCELWKKVA